MSPLAAESAIAPLQVALEFEDADEQIVLPRVRRQSQLIIVGENLVRLALDIVEVVVEAFDFLRPFFGDRQKRVQVSPAAREQIGSLADRSLGSQPRTEQAYPALGFKVFFIAFIGENI